MDDSYLRLCLVNTFGTVNRADLRNTDLVDQEVDVYTPNDFDFLEFVQSDLILFDPIECLFWKYVDILEQERLRQSILNIISSLLSVHKIIILTSNSSGSRYYDFLNQNLQRIKI